MTYWLTENSTVPMITGAILVVILLFMAFSGRDRLLAYAALGIGVLTIATVICERVIVTDQEEVTQTLHILADHVANNDTDAILGYISKKVPKLATRAASDMDLVNFESCRLLGTNYFIGPESGNKLAEICFVVVVSGTAKQGHGTANFKVTLNLEEESDGNWKILDYQRSSPMAGVNL